MSSHRNAIPPDGTENGYTPPVRREKNVSRRVLIADKIADLTIRVGGVLVIVTVLGIMVFLVREALPLFFGGRITATHSYQASVSERPLNVVMDEHKTLILGLYPSGRMFLLHAKSGTALEPPSLDLGGAEVTAIGRTPDRRRFALGFSDGTVRFGTMGFDTSILSEDTVPAGYDEIDDRDITVGGVVYSRLPGNQFRKTESSLTLADPITVSPAGAPIRLLTYRMSGEAERQTRAMVAVDGTGKAFLSRAESRMNLLTGEVITELERTELPDFPPVDTITALLMTEKGDNVYAADKQGVVYRFNTMEFDEPYLAETGRPLSGDTTLTALGLLLGDQTILAGGSDGSLRAFFKVEVPDAKTADGFHLVAARDYGNSASPVIMFAPSLRGKTFAAVHADGRLRVLHATSEKTIFDLPPESGTSSYADVLLSPKTDGLLALGLHGMSRLVEFSAPHPETNLKTLFGRVWYEGYPAPSYTWQSSAATDDFEQKLSLVPLIFGTLKATVYSLLFAVPVALLAAIHTSEFVHRRIRAVVKPVMELMASLPSVVLGFVAALVLAPVVEHWVAAVILAFVVFPISLVTAAYLWQIIPPSIRFRLEGIPKFLLMFGVTVGGIYGAYRFGPAFESKFFYGDFVGWVSGVTGSGKPFLFLLLLPAAYATVAISSSAALGSALRDYTNRLTTTATALIDLIRFTVLLSASALLAYTAAAVLTAFGVDPRGGCIDSYTQRNTFIIGITMGFAVIPIIYTLAEDALNAVPAHLRSASFGCGATPWQTAVYVIAPAAVSGIFSAVMIGMGRAVGETMIVVMAAGNTPLIDWNIFNGLRALSATIAIELPEAVKDGTLYRVLFLAGLVLFAMTFVINTLAEVVRLRFRKKARQL